MQGRTPPMEAGKQRQIFLSDHNIAFKQYPGRRKNSARLVYRLVYRPNLLGIPSQPPGIVERVFDPPHAQQ